MIESLFFMAVMSPLSLICLMLGIWPGWLTYQLSVKTLNKLEQKSKVQQQRGGKSGSNKSDVKLTMNLTILCTVSFSLALFSNLIWVSTVIAYMISTSNWKDLKSILNKSSVKICEVLSRFFQLVACMILLVISFKRLTMVFHHTQYKMSDQIILAVDCLTGFFFVTGLCSFATYANGHTLISMSLMSITVLGYVVLSLAIAWKFYTNTVAIAKGMRTADQNNQIMLTNANSESAVDHNGIRQSHSSSSNLLDASLRLTLITGTTTLSTLITIVLIVLAILFGSKPILMITFFCIPTDLLINQACVFWMFKEAEDSYLLVFGRLHRYISQSRLLDIG